MPDIYKPGQFLPGPWEVFLPGRKFVNQKRNFKSVCELNTHERHEAIVDATAHLIAAAPDLLEACELALAAFDRANDAGRGTWTGAEIDKMKAAVRKALGGTAGNLG